MSFENRRKIDILSVLLSKYEIQVVCEQADWLVLTFDVEIWLVRDLYESLVCMREVWVRGIMWSSSV